MPHIIFINSIDNNIKYKEFIARKLTSKTTPDNEKSRKTANRAPDNFNKLSINGFFA